jgi:CubicO group peptidase (beta-lactamase class C family)
MAENHVPAVGVGFIEKGKVKKLTVFGELRKGVPAPVDAIFNVASLTKPVAAMTVLKLVNEGQWSLDEPLSKYWIDPDVKDDPRHDQLTTRIILSHQTGFANWRRMTSNKLTFTFDPGTKFGYSGEGYQYLKRAIENKFGKTLQELSYSLLFKPLSMKDTRYGWSDQMDAAKFAEPHDANGNIIEMKKHTGSSAADWLVTTISDYTKFGVYVLRGAGLSKQLYEDMTSPQVQKDPGFPKEDNAMGLGWQVIHNLPYGEYVLTHNGSDEGVKTLIMLLPKSKRGIVIMTNGENGKKVISEILKASFSELQPDLAKYMEHFR